MRLILSVCFCLMLINAQAQEKKKTIIKKTEKIEKIVNEKGDTTVNREVDEVIEGDGSKDMSFEQAEKMMLDGNKDGEFLTVSKEINNDKETTVYTLTTINKGKKEVLKWEGEGEMPAKIKEKMKDVNINEERNGNKRIITIDANEKSKGNGSDVETRIIKKNIEDKNSDRIKLGVMIDDTREGVRIEDIIKDGYADKAGLNVGDIIVKLGGRYILSSELIHDALSEIKKGDKKEILILRNGKEKALQIQF